MNWIKCVLVGVSRIALVALVLGTAVVGAKADSVYLFDSNGSPVLLAGATYQDGVVFSIAGIEVGTVSGDGSICDPVTGAIIGVLVLSP